MMDWLNHNLTTFWLVFAFALLAIEVAALGLSTGVLLFAGIGALITGLLLWADLLPAVLSTSIAAFAILTTLLTALLWIPFKRMQSGQTLGHDRSSDLIGHEFILQSNITITSPGREHYSGIEWQVFPDWENGIDAIREGALVRVVRVSVGEFHVSPILDI